MRRCRSLFVVTSVTFLFTCDALLAQIGGTGTDGPLTPTANYTLDTSKNGGRFDFTRIDIPKDVLVTITGPNPAVLRCQGDVRIAGWIRGDGRDKSGGPGGFAGGSGSKYTFLRGESGQGPGGGPGGYLNFNMAGCSSGGPGGHATDGKRETKFGRWCWGLGVRNGSGYPFELRGGSGGGGACGFVTSGWGPYGISGAGGGGVVAILADGDIVISGKVSADGADSWDGEWQGQVRAGGPGAGGSVLLRSMRSLVIESSGSVSAVGGYVLPYFYMERLGGDGYVRLDCYAKPPVVNGKVEGKALTLEQPHLVEAIKPRIGKTFGVECASVPGDIVALFMAKRGANVPAPPFGILRLDLSADLIFYGCVIVPHTDDPIGRSIFPVHDNPLLNGLGLHVQGINVLTSSRRPRLTNSLVVQIRR